VSAAAAKRWIISGTVQGVGFRYFVQNKARALGLSGWARNLDNGSVEVYATGKPKSLDELAAALHIGPSMAYVRSVEEKNEPVQSFAGFSIR
jgi:acylphosphatase